MKLRQRKHHKASPEDLDIISTMPDIVITSILDRLPIQYAIRTSALSKTWRLKWTMLSQLVFDTKFSSFLCKTKREHMFERILSSILLNLKGDITKFALVININNQCCDKYIAHWILFLSACGVKYLTIISLIGELELPSHVFSCLKLEHLELVYCRLDIPSSFDGFPNLLSLNLGRVGFKKESFGGFIARCPALKTLYVTYLHGAKVKVADIAKLTNLEILTLLVCKLDSSCPRSIFELLDFLPKLQELKLDFMGCKSFTDDGARKRSSNTFPRLKSLDLSFIDLEDGFQLSFAFKLISSSPNLQTLKIKARERKGEVQPATCSSTTDYNTLQLLKLRSVVCRELKGSNNELCLIKFLLASSPFLEEIVIHPREFLPPNKKSMLATKMLNLHSTFPGVELKLCEKCRGLLEDVEAPFSIPWCGTQTMRNY